MRTRFLDLPAPLLVLVGPTAVGKTELALRLAEALNGEIVSADSRLFYRGMDIGTAKPTPDEQARVPHHLVDIVEPDHLFSLSEYQALAQAAIAEIHARRRLPVLVGGTGQYVRALVEGWSPPPRPEGNRLRDALERWGREIGPRALHTRLARIDPQAAAHIEPGNLRRTVRALEVIYYTGRRFSAQQHQAPRGYQPLWVGLRRPREELYQRIDARIDQMLANGWVEETRQLLGRYSPAAPAFSAIGYRELVEMLRGRCTLEEAAMLIRRQTRAFVRRQANWFKESDPKIHWYTMDPDVEQTIVRMITQLEIVQPDLR